MYKTTGPSDLSVIAIGKAERISANTVVHTQCNRTCLGYLPALDLPQTVRGQIEELTAQFPMEYMLMWTSIGGPSWEAQERCLKLFADKVMPYFK